MYLHRSTGSSLATYQSANIVYLIDGVSNLMAWTSKYRCIRAVKIKHK